MATKSNLPVLYPPFPHPSTSSEYVQDFLVQYFQALDFRLNHDDAVAKARKINLDGPALYECPKKTWIDIFGEDGRVVHDAVQASKHGYYGGYWPMLTVVGVLLVFFGLLSAASQFWVEEANRQYSSAMFIILTCLAAALRCFNLSCSKQSYLDSERFPEGLKIRQRSTQSGLWGFCS